jgi:hypothetical protein
MARDEPKVNIRLPQELKDKLHALAEKNKRSVNAEVVAAIEEALARDMADNPEGDYAMLGTGGLSSRFYTPISVLQEIAKMAAREAVGLKESSKKK